MQYQYTIPTWHKTIFKRAENHMSVHVWSYSFVKGALVCPVSYLALRASALHGFLRGFQWVLNGMSLTWLLGAKSSQSCTFPVWHLGCFMTSCNFHDFQTCCLCCSNSCIYFYICIIYGHIQTESNLSTSLTVCNTEQYSKACLINRCLFSGAWCLSPYGCRVSGENHHNLPSWLPRARFIWYISVHLSQSKQIVGCR